MADPGSLEWFYLDRVGAEWGPFGNSQMWSWFAQGVFKVGADLLVRLNNWSECQPVRTLFPDGNPFATRPLLTHLLDEGHDEASSASKRRPAEATGPPAKRKRPQPPPTPQAEETGARFDAPDWPPSYGTQGYPSPSLGYGPIPAGYGYPPSPGYGYPPPAYGYPPPAYGYPPPAYGYPPPDHGKGGKGEGKGQDGRYYGRIKSYNHTTGFGFIDCPVAKEEFGRDVYVHKQTIGTLRTGDDCSFVVELEKGKPQARDVWAVGFSCVKKGQRFVGRVKSFNEEKGYGFVDCPEAFDIWQRDAFIHKGLMAELEVGDEISFVVEVGKQGMPQTREVEPVHPRQQMGGSKKKQKAKTKNNVASNVKTKLEGPAPFDPTKTEVARRAKNVAKKEWSSLLIKNIPPTCCRADLVETLVSLGLDRQFDFVYLPASFKTLTPAGYGFVNMTSHDAAEAACKELDGWEGWVSDSFDKKLEVTWSTTQGQEWYIERYRNSPVMHPMVPDEIKPILFDAAGSEIPFPEPTITLKAPKARPGRKDGQAAAKGSDNELEEAPVEPELEEEEEEEGQDGQQGKEDDIMDWLRRTGADGDDDEGSGPGRGEDVTDGIADEE